MTSQPIQAFASVRMLALATMLGAITLSGAVRAEPVFRIETIGPTDAEHTAADGSRVGGSDTINQAGQVTGWSARYNGGVSSLGQTAWLYDGNSTLNVGLIDSTHTRSDGFRNNSVSDLNEAGQVLGDARRWSGSESRGRTVWLYDGNSTFDIGPTGPEYTRSNGARYSYSNFLNDAGQAVGNATFYDGSTPLGDTVWLYDGGSTSAIGLTDSEHTGNDGRRQAFSRAFNESGQISASARRYSGIEQLGRTAWLYDGSETIRIGLIDSEHTRSDGYRLSEPLPFFQGKGLNEAGHVLGYSERFDESRANGQSTWLFDGNNTINIGLTDSQHTSPDGLRTSSPRALNEASQVIGQSNRFDESGYTGSTAWLYDGNQAMDISLLDGESVREDGSRWSDPRRLNEAGQVAGEATRYVGGDQLGSTAWLYDGDTTFAIGLTDNQYTREDGYRDGDVYHLNEVGQVTGVAHRYVGSERLGSSAWLFDGSSTIDLTLSERSDGYAFSVPTYLGDDGLIVGLYTLFGDADNDLGSRAFWFHESEGLFDLGLLVDESFAEQDWAFLASAVSANLQGKVIGDGLLNDMPMPIGDQGVAYLVEVVPVPPAAWLFGSALGLLGWLRRKQA